MHSSAAVAPAREPAIRAELSRQESVIDELGNALTVLLNRLHPVLAPSKPCDNQKEACGRTGACEIDTTLVDHNQKIAAATNHIRDAIDRLEV